VRVIGPNPAYPTHSSAEAAHAGNEHITYSLDPKSGWQPDLRDMEEKIKNMAYMMLTQNLQTLIIENIKMKDYPNMIIVKECFKDFIVNKLEPSETPCDLFSYSRPLKYNSDKESNFPDFMKRKFVNDVMNKYKETHDLSYEYYSDYWKEFPKDFTDMVKNLKAIKPVL
jgi:hypothetical protein